MALKPIHPILTISFILILLVALIPAGAAHAMEIKFSPVSLPLLDTFVNQVKNGQADELRGVYVPGILAAPIFQQPDGDSEFISPRMQAVTQFNSAFRLGSTGLLAHNYLAGENFFLLKEGQTFYLIYGDGRVAGFVVTEILQYQALVPDSTNSDFLDLKNGRLLTASDLFFQVYDRPGQVIFQTCIAASENPSWGRLFVIGEPYSHQAAPLGLVFADHLRAH